MTTQTLKQPEQAPRPANEQARQWNTNGGQQGSTSRRTQHRAAKAREEQRREANWLRIRVAWVVRHIASRPGPDRQAAKALCAPLSAARSVDDVRHRLTAEGPSSAPAAAFLDRVVAQVVADT